MYFFFIGGVVFSAFDQVPSDLHDNAIVLGCLSFFVAFLMLIDLADPMARHTTDTTQTDPDITEQKEPNLNNNISQSTATEQSQVGAAQHLPNNEQNHRQNGSSDSLPLNGQYHRSDTVDFVQSRSLPIAQKPVFEKMLLPEKQRPARQNIPDPRSNTSRMEYSSHYAHVANTEPPAPPRHGYSQYNHGYHSSPDRNTNRFDHKPNLMVVRDFSRPAVSNNRNNEAISHQQQLPYRNSSVSGRHSSRRQSCRKNCSSDEDDIPSAIKPGFVAQAAKIWDNRAKQSELNTIV